MTHKYERQCWHCGSKNMEKLTNYVKCRDCGATWNITPHLAPPTMTEVDRDTDKAPTAYGPTRFKPRGVRHRGAKVVEDKRS